MVKKSSNLRVLLFCIVLLVYVVTFQNETVLAQGDSDRVDVVNITCQGPISIRLISEKNTHSLEDIRFNNCRKDYCTKQYCRWSCTCRGSFNIWFSIREDIFDIYTVQVEYYVFYDPRYEHIVRNSSQKPSLIEIEMLDNKREFKKTIQYGDIKYPLLDIEIKIENIILFSILFVLFIVGFFLYKIKNQFDNEGESDDVLNYNLKEDKDIDDIIKRL